MIEEYKFILTGAMYYQFSFIPIVGIIKNRYAIRPAFLWGHWGVSFRLKKIGAK